MKTLLLAAMTTAVVAVAGLSFAQSASPQQSAQQSQQTQQADDADTDKDEDFDEGASAEANEDVDAGEPASASADAEFENESENDEFASPAGDLEEPTALRDLRRLRPVHGDPAAAASVVTGCVDCHGGKDTAPLPGMPRLAGLNATYVYQQTLLYHKRYLPDTSMTPLADELSDEDMRNVSVYYASLPAVAPAPTAAADDAEDAEEDLLPPPTPQMLATGERIYRDGDARRGLPACVGCHGDDAMGHPLRDQRNRSGHVPYAIYPGLRGQDRQSLINRLNHYKSGDNHNYTGFHIMVPIAEKLDESSIDAVAAWLASLEG